MSEQWNRFRPAFCVTFGLCLGAGSCVYSNGSSFYIGEVYKPTTVYSGEVSTGEVSFGYFKLADSTRFSVVDDTFRVSLMTDSACTTTAAGSSSIQSGSSVFAPGGATTFSNFTYTWPDSRYEGKLYFLIQPQRFGISYCSSWLGVTQRFSSGAGYVRSGTTGLSGTTGSSVLDDGYFTMVDPQGHVISAGSTRNAAGGFQIAIRKYFPNGTLSHTYTRGSPAFGGGTGANQRESINGGIVDSGGKYVFAGYTTNVNSVSAITGFNMIVWRFNSDLTLDTSFNGTGFHTLTSSAGATGASSFDYGINVIQDLAGKYIVTGLSNRGGAGNPNEHAIWRFNNNGTLDTTWDGDGIYTIGATSFLNAGASQRDNVFGIKIDSQGRYVMAGNSRRTAAPATWEIIVARFLPTGGLDSSFGTAGFYRSGSTGAAGGTGANNYEYASFDFYLDSQERPVVFGSSMNNSGGTQAVVWRFTKDGQPDTTFGPNQTGFTVVANSPAGTAGSSQYDEMYAGAIDSKGRIYGVGFSMNGGMTRRAVIWRFLADGTLDTSWGSGGALFRSGANVLGHSGASSRDDYMSVAIDQFDRIVLTGSFTNGSGSARETVVERYWSTGARDL